MLSRGLNWTIYLWSNRIRVVRTQISISSLTCFSPAQGVKSIPDSSLFPGCTHWGDKTVTVLCPFLDSRQNQMCPSQIRNKWSEWVCLHPFRALTVSSILGKGRQLPSAPSSTLMDVLERVLTPGKPELGCAGAESCCPFIRVGLRVTSAAFDARVPCPRLIWDMNAETPTWPWNRSAEGLRILRDGKERAGRLAYLLPTLS
jgi:hypothetical protein